MVIIRGICGLVRQLECAVTRISEDGLCSLESSTVGCVVPLGCADARVPANEIMGEDAGSVFVVRNVANLVVNTDFNLMAALQFAVEVLKVQHIIVAGHYDCGGVWASMEQKDHGPPLENWLRNIRDV